MRSRAFIILAVGAFLGGWVASTVAQTELKPRSLERKLRRPMSPAHEMAKLRRFHDKLPRGLDLDEEQIEIVDEIFEEYFEMMQDQMQAQREARRENASEVRELVRELKDARQAGNDQQVSDLREQIADMRSGQRGEQMSHDELFEEIRAELDEDQLRNFDVMIKRLDQPNPASARFEGVKRIRRAVEGLDLTPEQQRETRAIFVRMQKESREAGSDPEAADKIEEAAIESILDLLDDDQADEFEEKLEELEKQKNRIGLLHRPHLSVDEEFESDAQDDTEGQD